MNSRAFSIRLLAVTALALSAACSVNASGKIPCADDSSCPADYPVCKAGVCVESTSGTSGSASVSILGVPSKAATDPLRGTVNVNVVAKASSGVKSEQLPVTPPTPGAPGSWPATPMTRVCFMWSTTMA